MPITPVPSSPTGPPRPTGSANWARIKNRATTIGSIAALFLFLVTLGGAIGYYYSLSKKTPPAKTPAISTLSKEELAKLSEIGANLGTTGQVLNIAADALFRGKVDVGGDLSIGGRLNANGPVTLSQLNITGTTAATGLNVGSNLLVSGATTLQKSLTVQSLVTLNGGLNVAGSASVNALNASSIAVHNISISGPLTISHLATQGPAPTIVAGSVGAGGTVSISGNDTAGTININTGTSPGTTLSTITFRASYTASIHVLLTPITSSAATAGAYATRNNGGFQVHANAAPSGQTLSFDYLIVQ